jgi:hypothetical protein
MGKKIVVTVLSNGETRHVADDSLRSLDTSLGTVHIQRASHVEPQPTDDGSIQWTADLSPVGGPLLGPFLLRADALEAEHQWLDAHLAELKINL